MSGRFPSIAAALITGLLLAQSSAAATIVESTQLVASEPALAAQVPQAIEFSIPAAAAGEYAVTLEDLGAPATLSSLRAIVTHDLAVVAQLAVEYPSGQPPSVATEAFAAAEGSYRIHVLGSAPADQGGGTFRVRVAPAAGGAALVNVADAIAAQTGPASSQSVLQATFAIADAGTYQLEVVDHAFPAALKEPPIVLLLRNTASGPVEVTRTVGSFTTDAGSHDLVVLATAAGTDEAGTYSVRISAGTAGAVPYVSTNPVGRMPAPIALGMPTAGQYSFTLADAAFPVGLSSLRAMIVQGGTVLTTRNDAGSATFAAAPGRADLFTIATTASVGAFKARVAQGSNLVHAGVHPVDSSADPQSAAIYAFAPAQSVAAGDYVLNLHDFRFPTPLRQLRALVVQGDFILGRIDAAGEVDAMLSSAHVNVLVAAEPAGIPGEPGSGLFGVELSAAGQRIFESTQGVGGLFFAQSVAISAAGRYDFTLADLEFPKPLRTSALAITRGTELVGQVFGAGTLPRQQLAAGTYVLSFIGVPALDEQYGAYGLKVSDSPAPPSVTLSANPATITSGERTTLQWTSSGATGCTAAGAWGGTKATSGTEQTDALSANATFEISCTGPGGTASASRTVTVNAPSASRGGGGGSVDPLLLISVCLIVLAYRRRWRSHAYRSGPSREALRTALDPALFAGK